MKNILLTLAIILPISAHAAIGKEGVDALKHCIMQNDTATCHSVTTPTSHDMVDRFISYKLMPCMPTDFTYDSESAQNGVTIVKASRVIDNNRRQLVKLAYTGSDPKLDIPATLRMGLGEKWENKIQLAESLFLMLRANGGGAMSCDQLEGLVKK